MAWGTKLFIICYVFLVIFQVNTTNIEEAYGFTPHQIDLSIKRMNMYPPNLARLGYILEVKREVQIVNKLIENFFYVVDFNEYFPRFLPILLSPFLFIGIYVFVKEREKRKLMFGSFVLAVVILTILGPHDKYGPVLIMPYFLYFILLGIICIKNILKKLF